MKNQIFFGCFNENLAEKAIKEKKILLEELDEWENRIIKSLSGDKPEYKDIRRSIMYHDSVGLFFINVLVLYFKISYR